MMAVLFSLGHAMESKTEVENNTMSPAAQQLATTAPLGQRVPFKFMTVNMQYHYNIADEMFKAGALRWVDTRTREAGKLLLTADGKNDEQLFAAWWKGPEFVKRQELAGEEWTSSVSKMEVQYLDYEWPSLDEQKKFVLKIMYDTGLLEAAKNVDAIATQEAVIFDAKNDTSRFAGQVLDTHEIMKLLGFTRVANGGKVVDETTEDDMYDYGAWLYRDTPQTPRGYPLPKQLLISSHSNEIYVRDGSKWCSRTDSVTPEALLTSSTWKFNQTVGASSNTLTDARADQQGHDFDGVSGVAGKSLSQRTCATAELIYKDGESVGKTVVRAMSTHISGGRFEDTQWTQQMEHERGQQIERISTFIDGLHDARPTVNILVGDYNSTPEKSKAMVSYGRTIGVNDDTPEMVKFISYMTAPLRRAVETGWRFTYHGCDDKINSVCKSDTRELDGPTAAFGHIVDWFAIKDPSKVAEMGAVQRVLLTAQHMFSCNKQDNAAWDEKKTPQLTDHNAVIQTFHIDVREMKRQPRMTRSAMLMRWLSSICNAE